MSGRAAVLAAEFPPGVDDFNFPGLVPGLEGTVADLAVTKLTLLVWFGVAVIIVLNLVAYRNPKIVPTRGQWIAESVYGFVREGVAKQIIGADGVRFAPYLTALFSFIALTNLFAVVPLAQISPNSHIAFPLVLAVMSYLLFIAVGVRRQGFVRYFRANLFPPGVPWPIYVILTPIELVSTFVMRPVSLAIRLFANMFAGHLLLLVFTLGGVALLASDNIALQGVSLLSFGAAIAFSLFEFVVALLQAYVFIVLTASYVGGALADEH